MFGDQTIQSDSSYSPLSLDTNYVSILQADDVIICSWHVLYLLCRSVSKVPANDKKERPLSTMSEASNYTAGTDYAGTPSSPAGRVSDTHEDWIIVHVSQVKKFWKMFLCIDPFMLFIHSFCIFSPQGLPKKFITLGKDPIPSGGIPVPQ